MKKLLFSLMSSVILCNAHTVCNAENNISIYVNTEKVYTSPIIKNDRTLVPIRIVSEKLGYTVDWNGDTQTITIKDEKNTIQLTINEYSFYCNDVKYDFDVKPQLINDLTYIPIRTVAENLGWNVLWSEDDRAVHITKKSVKDEEIDLNLLVEYNVISKEELTSDTYITNLEALKTINNVCNYGSIESSLSSWYFGNTLAPLDYLDDKTKAALLNICSSKGPITAEELAKVNLDENITIYNALVYITRMIGNTYGCTDSPAEMYFTEPIKTYETALYKGLISEIDMTTADEPITRDDFYKILYKSLFVERSIGGYSISRGRYIDGLIEMSARPEKESTPEPKPQKINIDIKATIHDDLSITWEMPEKYKNCTMAISTISKTGEEKTSQLSTSRNNITSANVLSFLLESEYNEIQYLRCTYMLHSTEQYFDIDVSNIYISVEGEAPEPGIFTPFKGQWVPKYITLADGQIFKKDTYYMITSYEHAYRKEEYNGKSELIFQSPDNSAVHSNENHNYYNCGGLHLEDMHIQEIAVTGDTQTGFTIHITPESTEAFTVVED